MNTYYCRSEELRELAEKLQAYDKVFLSGTVYTSRDAAHKKIVAAMEEGSELPFDLKDASIYYAGPTAAKPGQAIGSCGPTTSGRMDPFAPKLLDAGLVCMIGKGPRNQAVIDSIVKNGAVYLCALGGAGALASRCITSCEVIAYDELGCESVKKLELKDFPLVVGIDSRGNSVFEGK